MKMRLLPLEDLISTGPLDHADWNYRGIVGYVSRKRFSLIAQLLPKDQQVEKLLEIGYGSGVFMPELSLHAKRLYGIDIHDKNGEISAILLRKKVKAELVQGDGAKLPFDSAFFDCVVSVSALEFIPDLTSAVNEIFRVLKSDGVFVLVMPGSSPFLDFLLWLATGESAKKDYGDSRIHVLPELEKHFVIEDEKSFWPIYKAYRLRKK